MSYNITPIQEVPNFPDLFVKRDDLAFTDIDAPPFSKIRGLYSYMSKLKEQGYDVVGYTDTAVSMAGWGISYVAKQLGMRAVIYCPLYKELKHNQIHQFIRIKQNDGIVVKLDKPNYQKINDSRARKIFEKSYIDGFMLPQSLPLQATIDEIVNQIRVQAGIIEDFKSIVVCLGSGTMCVGILKGLKAIHSSLNNAAFVYGIMVAQKNTKNMQKRILGKAGIPTEGIFKDQVNFQAIDNGYEYLDQEKVFTPFPCNEFYDKKAYRWILQNINRIEKPILFWNIGGDFKDKREV